MPNPDVTTSAAPSAATETPNPYESGKLTQEISKQFLDTAQGKVQPKHADTASADTSKETTSAGKPESAAAPDSAKETQEKGSRRKPSAEERISELVAENKRLKEASGKETKTAEPVTRRPEAAIELKAPVKPKVEDFESWDKYEEAKDKYTEDLAEFKANKAVQDDRKVQAEAQQSKQLETELAQARALYKDYDTVVAPLWQQIVTDKAIHEDVREFVGRSTVMTHLMYAIGGDAETMSKFIEAAKTDKFAALRYAMKAEELVMAELAKGKTESKSEPEVKEKKDPPVKAKTEEPTPNREVGNRGTGPNDVAADAVRRNDFRTFEREQTRRAAERHRAG